MITHISDLNDARLRPFQDLRTRNWTVGSGWFIAEGPLLVERLLRSPYALHSVLVSDKYLSQWQDRLPAEANVWVVAEDQIAAVLGFHFHRGILACGLRQRPSQLRTALPQPLPADSTMVALVGVQDPENMGGILRSCAALGIEHILVGPGCADPLARRVLRVSMGTVLRLKLYPALDLLADLAWLRQEHQVESLATTLASDSRALESATRHGPLVILMGNEAHGLPPAVQAAADHRVRIDMCLGTDSLNVSVAAGIVLHHFVRVATIKSDSSH